jgi:hypothetical protein
LRLSDRGLVAVVLLPLGYVALPFLVGTFSVQPNLGRNGFVILVGLYVTFMGRIVLKDFRDEAGDRIFGKHTFLIRHGRADTCLFSAACWIAGSGALIALAPLRSTLIAVFVVYVACVLYGLNLLARADGFVADQVVIGGIAQVGRGMAITLLAHLTMTSEGWAVRDQSIVQLVLASTMVYLYMETVARRRTAPVAAIRPY